MKTYLLTAIASLLPLSAATPPNFIVIMTDDQGYADLGCFGSKEIKTPHLDQLAQEGKTFTSFYCGNPVCSASRAALMTGCYSKRVLPEKTVLFPSDTIGLHPEEVTIAETLKQKQYATACIGKWHLGHEKPFLPTSQGFDYYYGIPYSNDMSHPEKGKRPRYGKWDQYWTENDSSIWNTPLMENEEIIELPVEQSTITRRYTDKALSFIKEHQDSPFFLYLAHSMPHVPLYLPEDFYTEDPQQAYIATIQHIDAEVGRLVSTLKSLNLSENTYLIFTSDNGPWLKFKHHAGKAHPLSGGKGTTQEGGMRVPCIMWAPKRIPAGTTSAEITASMDLHPTIAQLAGITPKPRGKIDGLDLSDHIHGKAPSPRTEFLYFKNTAESFRHGDWKYSENKQKTFLYNLKDDIGEKENLAQKNPEKLKEMKSLFDQRKEEVEAGIRSMGNLSTLKH